VGVTESSRTLKQEKENEIMNNRSITLMATLAVWACFALSGGARAVSPTPDGCYPLFTTAEGCNALEFLTTGIGNTAIGWYSLSKTDSNSFNTGLGAGALCLNMGDANTAVGTAAMLKNFSGFENVANGYEALLYNISGSYNDAVGAFALYYNIDGSFNNAFGNEALSTNMHASNNTAIGDLALAYNDITGHNAASSNTAVGAQALYSNRDGNSNAGVGFQALYNNVDGSFNTAFGNLALFANSYAGNNTAIGYLALANNDVTGNNLAYYNTAIGAQALLYNADGNSNTAVGWETLYNNYNGNFNTASGYQALLENIYAGNNTAIGYLALSNNDVTGNNLAYYNTAIGAHALFHNTDGDSNTAVGNDSGANVVTANNVTCIGARVAGADVSHTTWIGNVYNVTPQSGTTTPVVVSEDGQLGTVASSEQFKKDIATMAKASETVLSLRPVTFHYKTDSKGTPQFGLIAEEVAKLDPALVMFNKEGKPFTVRYDAVNVMLLNEFLKEHRRVESQDSRIQKQEAVIAQQQKQIDALTAGLQRVSAELELSKSAPQAVLNSQ
jgi:Chaperone of endosialidase